MTAVTVSELPEVTDHLRQLVELWSRVEDLNGIPEAEGLSGGRALESAVLIARVRHTLDGLLAPYAARLDELSDPSQASRFARWKGFPNAAALLAAETGLSATEMNKLIRVGRPMPDAGEALPDPPIFVAAPEQPEAPGVAAPAFEALPTPVPVAPPVIAPLAAAIRAGRIGTEKIAVIRRTLDDMTANRREAEEFLVGRAEELNLVALRRLCLTTFSELDPEGYAQREARQFRDRRLSIREEDDGMVSFYAKLPPVLAAPAKAWFEAEMQSAVAAQREEEEQRTLGQILADSFLSTVMHAAGCDRATTRAQSTWVIRSTKSSVESGDGFATCDGIEAPITMRSALALAADVQFAGLLTDDEGVPLKLGHTSRLASAGQRLAVAQRDKGCAKCSRAISKANFHHIVYWENHGPTDERNLVMLCVGCHHQIHDQGWGIVVENNEVWFVPPAKVDPTRRRQPGSSVRHAA